MIMLNFRLKEPLMLKAVLIDLQPKPVRLCPKLILSFRVIGSLSVMAEGGKVNVEDGKSTEGKREKQFNYSQPSVWKMSHDHHFQFGA